MNIDKGIKEKIDARFESSGFPYIYRAGLEEGAKIALEWMAEQQPVGYGKIGEDGLIKSNDVWKALPKNQSGLQPLYSSPIPSNVLVDKMAERVSNDDFVDKVANAIQTEMLGRVPNRATILSAARAAIVTLMEMKSLKG